jgi:hypothetical protein
MPFLRASNYYDLEKVRLDMSSALTCRRIIFAAIEITSPKWSSSWVGWATISRHSCLSSSDWVTCKG